MGGLTGKSSTPSLPPPPKPPAAAPATEDTALTEDRLRRQRAAGRQGNIVSSLAEQVEDINAPTRISSLLG